MGRPVRLQHRTVTNQIAITSRPSSAGQTEREAADDFVTTAQTMITSATFTGLLVGLPGAGAPSVADVAVEMYRVFPLDSDITRTPAVPTAPTRRPTSPCPRRTPRRASSRSRLRR